MTINGEVALAILAAFGVLAFLALMSGYLIIGMTWERSPLRLNADGELDPAISGWSLVIRALALRCPRCGRGRIFGSHFRMNDNCFECGATFWKNDGEWLGPAVADYTMATAAGLVAWAVLVLLGASSTLQLVLAGLATVVIALAFSRFTRSFWTMLLYISGDMADTPSQARNP